jgi:hypothetical protein
VSELVEKPLPGRELMNSMPRHGNRRSHGSMLGYVVPGGGTNPLF